MRLGNGSITCYSGTHMDAQTTVVREYTVALQKSTMHGKLLF